MKIISSNEEKIIKKIKILYIWVTDGKGLESIKNDLSNKIELDYIFNKKDFLYVIKKKLNLT